MFSQPSVVALALVAISAKVIEAAVPACVLAAVNTEPNPTDLNTICGVDAAKVQVQISSLCGANANVATALSVFSSVCSTAGYAISTSTPRTRSTVSVSTSASSSTMVSAPASASLPGIASAFVSSIAIASPITTTLPMNSASMTVALGTFGNTTITSASSIVQTLSSVAAGGTAYSSGAFATQNNGTLIISAITTATLSSTLSASSTAFKGAAATRVFVDEKSFVAFVAFGLAIVL